ncbi:hypothetical protein XH88_28575 [Bradyrhizobium sp. CCBAU 51627]|nr:hypothetical protein [Bradyrhizobium sp. CCBAU 51627]
MSVEQRPQMNDRLLHPAGIECGLGLAETNGESSGTQTMLVKIVECADITADYTELLSLGQPDSSESGALSQGGDQL